MSPEFVIRIIVRARNEVAGVMSKIRQDLEGLTHGTDRSEAATRKYGTTSRREYSEVARAIHAVNTSTERARASVENLARDSSKLESVRERFRGVGNAANNTSFNVAKVDNQLRGLLVVGVLAFAQQMISALVGLAAELLAVAASAAQAGAALGGAMVAGLGQAIPMVGLLIAAFGRVGAVFKAVQQSNKSAAQSAYEHANAMDRQRQAADQIADAQRAVVDADKRVTESTQNLTQARREAQRQLTDLILAEERAELAARGANLSHEEAVRSLEAAVRAGNIDEIQRARLNVDETRLAQRTSRVQVGRTQADAGRGREGGVEGMDTYRQAVRQLDQARESASRARRELERAKEEAQKAADYTTGASRALEQQLALLTPAERKLYEAMRRVQERFKTFIRPITDTIITAFTGTANTIGKLLGDNRILEPLRRLSGAIGTSISRMTAELGSKRNINLFGFLADEARKNSKPITDIAINLSRIFGNVARAAAPALRLFLSFLRDLTAHGAKASENSKGLTEFFMAGTRAAISFLRLGGALIKLFLALSGQGGAASGKKAVDDLTASVNRATKWVQDHGRVVAKFFDDARKTSYEVARVIFAIAREMVNAFNPSSVKSLADLMTNILLPALGSAVQILGTITHILSTILNLPFVKEFAQFALTVGILGKAFGALNTVVDRLFVGVAKAIPALRGFLTIEKEGVLVSRAAGLATNPWILGITAVVAAIVLLDRKFHFLAPTVKFITGLLSTAWQAIKDGALAVINWMKDHWDLILAILVGPFGLAVRAIIKHWDDIKDVVRAGIHAVVSIAKGATEAVVGAFSAIWHGVSGATKTVFGGILKFIEGFWGKLKEGVGAAKDGVVNVFRGVVNGIKSVFTSVFKAIYGVVRDIVNTMIKGVNAISGKVKVPGIGNVNPLSGMHIDELPPYNELAAGDYIRARPGGHRAIIGEGGHDEVVLTSDPKHADRTRGLLARFLDRAGHVLTLAQGAYVQGAVPPTHAAARSLASSMMGLGFNITDALRGGGRPYHGTGDALDFGDSVNNLTKLWSVLYPARRAFAELFGPTSLSHGGLFHFGQRFTNPKLQADHQDHIHVAILTGLREQAARLGSTVGTAVREGLPGIFRGAIQNFGGWFENIFGSDPGNRRDAFPFTNALSATYKGLRIVAKDVRDRVQQGVDQGQLGDLGTLPSYDGNVAGTVFRVGRAMHATFKKMLAAAETGLVESGMRNLPYGDGSSVGWRQETAESYPGVDRMNVSQAAGRFFREAASLDRSGWSAGTLAQAVQRSRHPDSYDAVRGQALALLKQFGIRSFDTGGIVEGLLGKAVPAVLHAGEMVLTPLHQMMLGGRDHLMDMFGFRAARADGRFQSGGVTGDPGRGTNADSLFSDTLRNVPSLLRRLRDISSKSKKFLSNFEKAMANLTREGGLLDQLSTQYQRMVTHMQVALKRATYKLTASGQVIKALSDQQIAERQVDDLRTSYNYLVKMQDVLVRAINTTLAKMAALMRGGLHGHEKKQYAELQGILGGLEDSLDGIRGQIADNLASQYEAVTAAITAQVDKANADAATGVQGLDIQQRINDALGQRGSIGALAESRIAIINKQISDLSQIDTQGRADIAASIASQIAELRGTIAQIAIDTFHAQIDQVEEEGQRAQAAGDRINRIADIRERMGDAVGAAGMRGSALSTQRNALISLRSNLAGLFQEAFARGDEGVMRKLTDEIADLDVQLQENTQALADNSVAVRQAQIDAITNRGGFLGGIFGGLNNIVQTLGAITGNLDVGRLTTLTRNAGTVLGQTGEGLRDQLASIFGIDARGLHGTSFVDFMRTLNFDQIESGMSEAQRQQFEALINAIIENEGAIQSNTQSLNDLTGQMAQAQSFSSSAWQIFRSAVFTGMGGLLPSYDIPHMQLGGPVVGTGPRVLHDGEFVVRSDRSNVREGDTIVNVYESEGHLNEEWIAARVGFARSHGR